MKTLAACLLLLGLTTAANAAVVWDESVNGDLSTNPAAPTHLVFSVGSNVVTGTVANINAKVRKVITFTVPPGHTLPTLTLLAYSPENTGFCAINEGTTSVVPSNLTADFFMAGLHLTPADVGSDLIDLFMTRSVTPESLQVPELDPGDYCFTIQQTSVVVTSFSLDFVLSGPVPTEPSTWGSIKALYR